MKMAIKAVFILLVVIAADAVVSVQGLVNGSTETPATTGTIVDAGTTEQNTSTLAGTTMTPTDENTSQPATKQPTAQGPTVPSTKGDATTRQQATSEPTSKPSEAASTSSFNAASFIGGIVLGIALTVISAFGYGFYKTRRDKNYHTL